MKRGRGLLLLEKVMEATSEETRLTVQQSSVEKDVTNSNVAALTDETTEAVAAAVGGTVNSEAPDPVLSNHSNEEDFIDDSDTDPPFSVPVKQLISRPQVIPRRLSSSSSSSSSSATTEKSRHQQRSVEKGVENSTVAVLINGTSAVAASGGGALDREVPVRILSNHSDEEDSIDDSDTDPTFCVPVKPMSRPLVIPRRLSSSSSSSSSSGSRSSSPSSSSSSRSNAQVDDESNRPGSSTVNAHGDSNSTVTNIPSSSTTIDTTQSVSEPMLSRKRKRNPTGWKSKIAKTLRNSGKAYVSLTNPEKRIAERQIRPPCGDKCKLDCQTKIHETERQVIFKQFWQLGDLEKQREYIVRHTHEIKPKYNYDVCF